MLIESLFKGKLPKAIIFDLDGTLVDSAPDIHRAICNMLAELALPAVGADQVKSWLGDASFNLVKRALFFAQSPNTSIERSSADIQQALTVYFKHYEATDFVDSALYPGVDDTLKRLHRMGIKMAIVTNKPGRFAPMLLSRLGIKQYFDVVVSGDTLKEKKPSPLPLLYALKKMDVKPGDGLMIGDSNIDIDAAKASHMKSICVTYGYHRNVPIESMGADAVVNNLRLII